MFWNGRLRIRPAGPCMPLEEVLIRSAAEIEIIIQQAPCDIGADFGALGSEQSGREPEGHRDFPISFGRGRTESSFAQSAGGHGSRCFDMHEGYGGLTETSTAATVTIQTRVLMVAP